jgi:HK97 family phage prohead protease
MPYGISNKQSDCNGWAMVKQNADGTFETMACYTNKKKAIDYMIAASLGEDVEPIGEIRAPAPLKDHPKFSTKRNLDLNEYRAPVDLSPPEYMKTAAKLGLKYHAEGLSGDGIVPQTVEDARKMASGTVTEEKWRKIAPWIARHLSDLDAIQGDEITAGFVAHLLWGSDGTKEGAKQTMDYAEKVVSQLDAQTENEEQRELPASYRPADSEDVPAERNCGNCEYFDAENSMCSAWNEKVEISFYCDRWEEMQNDANDSPDIAIVYEEEMDTAEKEMYSRTNHWVVAERENRSVAFSNLELRASADGKTLVGYAAVFDSPSEPLPWTEFVRRGAFAKTIKDGADVRLLIDHEGVPLARSKSGTLTMQEDDFGLRIEAMLDENNPDAAKVMSALRRGDLSQMSFAFQTVKDSWSTDKRTRELKEVRLYDVSVVTYPAYEETVAELRNKNNTQSATVSPVAPLALRKRQIQLRQLQAEQ